MADGVRKDEEFSGTKEVEERHRINEASLDGWMREHVEGYQGPLSVLQFKGGQSNPTYKLLTPERDYVYRLGPREMIVQVEIEARKNDDARRAPMNLSIVLDRSGSMSGAKLEKARQAEAAAADRRAIGERPVPSQDGVARAHERRHAAPADLEADAALCRRVDAFRLKAGVLMGLGDVATTTVPKVCVVAPNSTSTPSCLNMAICEE